MILEETTSVDSIVVLNKSNYKLYKRATDVIFSLIGLIMLIPIFLILAVAIKIDDPKGTVYFSQDRVGKDGVSFRMYKFRSMYSDAEERLTHLMELNEIDGPMFKMKEDPRVTPVGKFIRKTSIDELPQLFNVLLGNMSLIGPRPALPREVAEYTEYDKQRLLVTPGISGLWQVSGRSALTFSEMVELDLKYIQKRSFWFDLAIFFKTIVVVMKKDNAY